MIFSFISLPFCPDPDPGRAKTCGSLLLCNPRGFIESWRCYIHSKGIWFIGLKERCKISGALTQKKIRKGKRSNENRCFISANYTSKYLYSTGFVRIAVRLAGRFLPSIISHRAESQADIPIEYGCISYFFFFIVSTFLSLKISV